MDLAQYAVNDSDIEFLAKKERDSNLIRTSETSTSTGEKADYTPASGKTFYLYRAWMVPQRGVTNLLLADVEIDGTAVDSLLDDYNTASGLGSQKLSTNTFASLVGDGAKKVRINVGTNSNSASYDFYILGWIEDT